MMIIGECVREYERVKVVRNFPKRKKKHSIAFLRDAALAREFHLKFLEQ